MDSWRSWEAKTQEPSVFCAALSACEAGQGLGPVVCMETFEKMRKGRPPKHWDVFKVICWSVEKSHSHSLGCFSSLENSPPAEIGSNAVDATCIGSLMLD